MSTTTNTFVPTQARGAELAREVLTTIEAEARRAHRAKRPLYAPGKNRRAWNQGLWGHVDLSKVSKGVRFVTRRKARYTQILTPPGLACGTAMCFAGHATMAVGDLFVIGQAHANTGLAGDPAAEDVRETMFSDEISVYDVVRADNGRVESIADRARKLLGLTQEEANEMFAPGNDLPALRKHVKAMERGENIVTGAKKRRR